ncbi:hypothetical protein [Streptomyces sp. 7-21]|uniref:hypothetical protein n=1 Tax=Streptomyces sp. 7-21 TaxID=2802283 RepID=UPI00191DCF56|nr:hypothetical protein [Streptomyces sp. 7-21]MBL1065418.1 hypothetical protein [Streptomyces sp. 7-21]
MRRPLYKESGSLAWPALWFFGYLSFVAWCAADEEMRRRIGLFIVFCGAVLLCFLIPVLGSLHVFFFHRIRLTKSVLRVGFQRIPVSEIDPGSVAEEQEFLADLHRGPGPPIVRSERETMTRRRLHREGRALFVGGSWAIPLGRTAVVVALRSGEPVQIASRDPLAFIAALAMLTGAGATAAPVAPPATSPPPVADGVTG